MNIKVTDLNGFEDERFYTYRRRVFFNVNLNFVMFCDQGAIQLKQTNKQTKHRNTEMQMMRLIVGGSEVTSAAGRGAATMTPCGKLWYY